MPELAPVPDLMKNKGVGIAQPEAIGVPSTETVGRKLRVSDNGASLICPSAITFMVVAERPAGFGVAAFGAGAVTFVGFSNSAAIPTPVINDYRTTGAANPSCALVQMATMLGGAAVDVYGIYGTKA